MKKVLKKMISCFLSCILVLSTATVAFAEPLASPENKVSYSSSDVTLSEESLMFLEKVTSVSSFYYIDPETNLLSLSLDAETLMNDYDFTASECDKLFSEVLGTYVNPDFASTAVPFGETHVEGNTLYISAMDLRFGAFASLATAASAGPAALAAAFTALSTAIGGPVGAILGGIVSAVGALSLASMCATITTAVLTNKGIYISLVLAVPPVEIGLWNG